MSKNRLILAGLTVCLILAAIPLGLSAAAADDQVGTLQVNTATTTAPAQIPTAAVSAAKVSSSVATKYWLELKAYPAKNTRGLWLYAGNDWRYLPNPSSNIESSVQQAFDNPNTFQVQVWYSGNTIVGLVVNTK
ncbi:MAG TPA: hypothetical protein VGK06_11265 [Methanosarcina sp.]|jgi:hypothetical protein